MAWGPNPREGFFEGSSFFHPDLAVQIRLPEGWKTENSKQALQAASSDGAAALRLSLSAATDMRQAAQAFFSAQGAPQAGQANTISLNEFEAFDVPFSAVSNTGSRISGRAVFVQDGRRVYELLAYGIESRYQAIQREVERSLGTFSRLRDRCRLDVQPSRIEVVQAQRGVTLASLTRGAPAGVDINTLALINHLQPNDPLQTGELYKRIVAGSARCST